MDVNAVAIAVLLGSFAVMIFLRFPIAYAVGLSSVFCLLTMGNSLNAVCRLMVKGISSFSLMAVPFFITMGVLMGKGGISVGSLFLAGYLPGAILAIALMVGSYVISVKRNYPKGEKFRFSAFLKQLSVSIWALLAIVVVVVGVVGGAFTATESAAIAVLYSLVVSVFVYKGVDWKGVWRALDECVNTLAIVMILIATPILLPVATQYCGLDPIQFGIMVVLNCGIGLLTPPVGAVLFIGSAVAKRPMEKVVKATLPFYACMVIALLLISFIPDISLLIPKLCGYDPAVPLLFLK